MRRAVFVCCLGLALAVPAGVSHSNLLQQLGQMAQMADLKRRCTDAFDASSAAGSCSNSSAALYSCWETDETNPEDRSTVCRTGQILWVTVSDLSLSKCTVSTTCKNSQGRQFDQTVDKTVEQIRNLTNNEGQLQ